MNYIVLVKNPELRTRYLERLNGFSAPTLTMIGADARVYVSDEAQEIKRKLEKLLKKSADEVGSYVELEAVNSDKPADMAEITAQTQAEPEPQAVKWSTRLDFFGVTFDMAKKGNERLYRCTRKGKTMAQKRDGRIIAEMFCRFLYSAMTERLESYEREHSDM